MANDKFYSKGTIKIKNADGVSVPFMPNTDISNVRNIFDGTMLSQTITSLNTRISEAAHKGGIKVMYEEPDDENTSDFNIKTLIGYIDPYIKAKPNEWYITVKTSNKQAAIPFQLYNQAGITLDVDWGDDTQSTLTSADYTNDGTDTSSIHTYASDGIYTIKIVSSDWSNTQIAIAFTVSSNTYSTGTSSSYEYINTTYYNFLSIFRKTLYQVNSEIPSFKGIVYKSSAGSSWYSRANTVMGAFAYCSKLIYIPPDIFKHNKTKTNYNACFCGCSALKEIPKDIFKGCSAGQYFDYIFADCTSITSIPSHLFDDCINAEYFDSVFSNTRIAAIPAGLFDYNTKAISFSKAFSRTKITEIPAHLFDNTKGYCYVQTFYNTPITSIPAGLFNHRGSRFDACFSGTKITSIPPLLFEDCTMQVFWQVFEYCRQLTSIPEQLFKNCTSLSTFDYAFHACSSLTSIPEDLFSYGPAIHRAPYMFMDCTSLTSIPEHLFDNSIRSYLNGNDLWFDYMFAGCTSLTSLPEGLFANMVKDSSSSSGVDCKGMFKDCISLASLPENLFKNLGSRLESVIYCFQNCRGLTTIPENLFKYSTYIGSFDSCFYNCSSLTDFTIHIGSTKVSSCSSFVSTKSGATRIVYVPSGSTTETTFNDAAASLGLTIIGE